MNCNDCGGFLPGGCECSPFGGRSRLARSQGKPPLDERLKEHAAARVDAARAELRKAIEAQRGIAGVVIAAPAPVAWYRTFNGTRMGVSFERLGGTLLPRWKEHPLVEPAAGVDSDDEPEQLTPCQEHGYRHLWGGKDGRRYILVAAAGEKGTTDA